MILLIHIVVSIFSLSSELSNISKIEFKIKETITHILFLTIILNVNLIPLSIYLKFLEL
jgi:hypothetical protein